MKNIKVAVSFVVFAALVLLVIRGYQNERKPAQISKQTATASNDTIATDTDQLRQYYATYKDPYVLHVRKALDAYLTGTNAGIDDPETVTDSSKSPENGILTGLDTFSKDYYRSKFVVVSVNENIAGGKLIRIEFPTKPDKIFVAWVYKLADDSYDLRLFGQDLSYTQEKLQQFNSQYKSLLDDKRHSL